MGKSIYVVGGWGYGNKGDNAIFEGMLQTFRGRFSDYKLCVTSFSPRETKEQHDVDSINSIHRLLAIRRPLSIFRWMAVYIWRMSGFRIMLSPVLLRHIKLIKQSSAVVMGGGGYFNDEWPDMLRALYVVVDIAKITDKPVVVYGQTVGPFSEKTINSSLKHYLKEFSRIAYRDVQSQKVLKNAGVPESKMVLSADEANLLSVRTSSAFANQFGKTADLVIGVMIQKFRPHLGVHGPTALGRVKTKQQYLTEFSQALLNISSANPGTEYLFIPSTTWDEATCKEVFDEVRRTGAVKAKFLSNPTADQFIAACQSVELMISTNMHPVILAATADKPSLAISYHYKLDDFMKSIGLGDFVVRIDDFCVDEIVSLAERALSKRKELGEEISSRTREIKALANKNGDSLKSVLGA
ncbi:MAG: polysaccharide pyruvyl transferase [Firmicutes bacterium]|nr:polysaccharide pyruvyl transferase [Bacillota bacterium]